MDARSFSSLYCYVIVCVCVCVCARTSGIIDVRDWVCDGRSEWGMNSLTLLWTF